MVRQMSFCVSVSVFLSISLPFSLSFSPILSACACACWSRSDDSAEIDACARRPPWLAFAAVERSGHVTRHAHWHVTSKSRVTSRGQRDATISQRGGERAEAVYPHRI